MAKRSQPPTQTRPQTKAKKRRGRPPARESAAVREQFGDARVIKRYSNRRFYDSSLSRNVTLEEIAEYVRHGEEVVIVDADSGEDLTRRILAQIILEDSDSRRLQLIPVEFLRKLIAARDDSVGTWMQQYLAAGAEWIERQMSGVAPAAVQQSLETFMPWLKAAAAPQPAPSPPPRRAAPTEPRADEVQSEIDELQQRLANLAAKVKRRS